MKIVDIFAGPGGLGEGFASFRDEKTKKRAFQISVSAEMDAAAHRTLVLRSFFRSFESPSDVPDSYYRYLADPKNSKPYGDETRGIWNAAQKEALKLELGVEADNATLYEAIRSRISADEPWVLIGGPPCQAYSLIGRVRNLGNKEYKAEDDKRHFLYREYLRIVDEFKPSVFIMENVRGILSSKVFGEAIFEKILTDLEDPARAVRNVSGVKYDIFSITVPDSRSKDPTSSDRFIVRAEKFGIPQTRHRVILVGVRQDSNLSPPEPLKQTEAVAVGAVLSDLPRLRSGLSASDSSEIWLQVVERGRTDLLSIVGSYPSLASTEAVLRSTEFDPNMPRSGTVPSKAEQPQSRMPEELADWISDSRLTAVLNHQTRAHMESDLQRYLFCAAYTKANGRSPKSRFFPKELAPAHVNWIEQTFTDRFRAQSEDLPATTVTSHIAKDGHYFVHYDPAQCRSLTVREAARLQTFPDNYFFEGNRTEQYRQVGNAVPPLLAHKIAAIVHGMFQKRPSIEKHLASCQPVTGSTKLELIGEPDGLATSVALP